MNDTTLTITGNLVDDPELRFTPAGQPVAKFRIASTPRYLDKTTNEWKDGDSLFLTCSVWRQAAENVAESLTRGMRVIVTGRLKQRSYETREGEKRTVYEGRGRRGRAQPAERLGQGPEGHPLQRQRGPGRGRAGQLRRQGRRPVGGQRARWLQRRAAFLRRAEVAHPGPASAGPLVRSAPAPEPTDPGRQLSTADARGHLREAVPIMRGPAQPINSCPKCGAMYTGNSHSCH
jgi:single stranded DNA-binding protein